MTNDVFHAITGAVHNEVQRQDTKWGDQRTHPNELWTTILMEEVGEVAKAVLEKKEGEVATELIQVIAVCYQMINSMAAKPKNE